MLRIAVTGMVSVLCVIQNSRRKAFIAAASYYAGATWPVILAVRNFFGPERWNSERDWTLADSNCVAPVILALVNGALTADNSFGAHQPAFC